MQRLCWIRVGPKSSDRCPSKEKKDTPREEGHVKEEAKVGAMRLEAEQGPGLRAATRSQRGVEQSLPQSLQKEPTSLPPGFQTVASRRHLSS